MVPICTHALLLPKDLTATESSSTVVAEELVRAGAGVIAPSGASCHFNAIVRPAIVHCCGNLYSGLFRSTINCSAMPARVVSRPRGPPKIGAKESVQAFKSRPLQLSIMLPALTSGMVDLATTYSRPRYRTVNPGHRASRKATLK